MISKAEYEAIPEQERMNCILEGIAYYSSVHKPNLAPQKQFDALPLYVTTIALDEENQAKAEKMGLLIKAPNEYVDAPHVQIKRKIKPEKTPEEVKPKVVDGKQNPIPSNVLVGNGSKVTVKFGTYWHRSSDKWGVGTVLFKMQVLDLVPFIPDEVDSDLAMTEDGFDVSQYLSGDNENTSQEEPEEAPKTETKTKAKKAKKTSSEDDIFDE